MSLKPLLEEKNSDFEIEPSNKDAKITGVHESLLQEAEKDIIWYRDYFIGRTHTNLLATETSIGPVAVSLIKDENHYKILVRTTNGSERLMVPTADVTTNFVRKLLRLGPSSKDIVLSVKSDIPVDYLTLCKNANLPGELLAMEERQVIRSYKFGVLYCADGQDTEEEIFQNNWENTSESFKKFMNFLGEKIELSGWKGYRAGLDVRNGQTGKNSYYTKWQGYEIMFHVAPMLPYKPNDKQQLERKRHVGNDIVVLIFCDGDSSRIPFRITTMSSKQNHVYAAVRPVKSKKKDGEDGYVVNIARKNGVPDCKPELPEPCFIESNAVSRDFLLYKLVNSERASYKSPEFAPKISRTRSVLLYDVAERFVGK